MPLDHHRRQEQEAGVKRRALYHGGVQQRAILNGNQVSLHGGMLGHLHRGRGTNGGSEELQVPATRPVAVVEDATCAIVHGLLRKPPANVHRAPDRVAAGPHAAEQQPLHEDGEQWEDHGADDGHHAQRHVPVHCLQKGHPSLLVEGTLRAEPVVDVEERNVLESALHRRENGHGQELQQKRVGHGRGQPHGLVGLLNKGGRVEVTQLAGGGGRLALRDDGRKVSEARVREDDVRRQRAELLAQLGGHAPGEERGAADLEEV
mmetsp:Transcript_46202/g.119492  ORF Transcript_46202/g.119492 Transcript_46202/m.119492 type:complete len:262 (-) Transcript_46202:2331-3116(-)